MGQGILIIAESGAGKSTSIETLDPTETFIINVANKALPFKGWRKKYSIWSKDNPAGNMYDKAGPENIEACLKYISEKRTEIKTIVVDDFQYMSSFEFFDKADEKGYEKFTKIGAHLTRIARIPKDLREDLQNYFLTHAEESTDIEGKRKFKAKTIGKMVDEKLTLEGLFSIVLFGKTKKNKEGEIRYVFETQTNGENTCKSPRGMFDTLEIPNDLKLVRDSIIAYEN
jgi:uncharacterized protein YbdZ (MbtH family)